MLNPQLFFDLKDFLHQDLFISDKPIWETLKNLRVYFEGLKLGMKLGKIECDIPPSVTLVNSDEISIGKGSTVEPGATIEGPCVIGEGCQIRQGAYIRPFVLTGKGCVLGHASELKHCILLNHASAPHFNYVGDSILGNHVNLGAGVICANYRLDHGEVQVEVEGAVSVNVVGKLFIVISLMIGGNDEVIIWI